MSSNALKKTDQADDLTARTKAEASRVTGRLKKALDFMVYEGLRFDAAAVKAGLTVRTMRLALERPWCLKYLREQKQVFRASISAQNIHALADIRDASDNAMAKLGAIKVLEQIDSETSANPHASRLPGFNITIVNHASAPAQPPTIELTPLNNHGSDDET